MKRLNGRVNGQSRVLPTLDKVLRKGVCLGGNVREDMSDKKRKVKIWRDTFPDKREQLE